MTVPPADDLIDVPAAATSPAARTAPETAYTEQQLQAMSAYDMAEAVAAAPDDVPCLSDSTGKAAWRELRLARHFAHPLVRFIGMGALRFLRWLEPQGINLVNVSALDVVRFLDDLKLRHASKRMYRTALRRFFDVLVAHGVARANPADHARLTAEVLVGCESAEPEPIGSAETNRRKTSPTPGETASHSISLVDHALRREDQDITAVQAINDQIRELEAKKLLLVGQVAARYRGESPANE